MLITFRGVLLSIGYEGRGVNAESMELRVMGVIECLVSPTLSKPHASKNGQSTQGVGDSRELDRPVRETDREAEEQKRQYIPYWRFLFPGAEKGFGGLLGVNFRVR